MPTLLRMDDGCGIHLILKIAVGRFNGYLIAFSDVPQLPEESVAMPRQHKITWRTGPRGAHQMPHAAGQRVVAPVAGAVMCHPQRVPRIRDSRGQFDSLLRQRNRAQFSLRL